MKQQLALVNDSTFSSDNALKLIMKIDENFENEQLQYDINTTAAKISVLSSGKIDKYEYLKDEEILPQVISQRRLDPEVMNEPENIKEHYF